MRKISILALCILLCICVVSFRQSTSMNYTISDDDDSTRYERNILPLIQTLNGDDKGKPKKDFRQGHVTEATLKNYLDKTDYGFAIKLGSHTNVPTPSVINGKIYVSGGFGSKQYYSFDAQSGELQWGINLDDDGPSSAAIEDGIIVFNTESCTIFACDLVTGKQIWSYWLGDPLMSMPSIANGIVFTSYPAHYQGKTASSVADSISIFPSHVLIAIELKTGKILWQNWIDSDIMSAPVAKDDLLYVTTFSGALYKIAQQTGNIIEAKAIRATSAPIILGGGNMIVSQRADKRGDGVASEAINMRGATTKSMYRKQATYLDKKVQEKSRLKNESMSHDAGNGFSGGAPSAANWKAGYDNIGQSNVSSLQGFQGSRALVANGNYYNTMGDEIVCTDSTGKMKWQYKLSGDMNSQGGFLGTPPISVNGHIIVATLAGEVLVINQQDGKLDKKYVINDPVRYQPVVDNGWIYVTSTNGKLHAIDTGDKSITGWNMWGKDAARSNGTN